VRGKNCIDVVENNGIGIRCNQKKQGRQRQAKERLSHVHSRPKNRAQNAITMMIVVSMLASMKSPYVKKPDNELPGWLVAAGLTARGG
jgi:hypothetical protein